MVTSASAFNSAAGGTGAAVIGVMGRLSGTFTIGSNKTIIGMCGGELDGHIQMSPSTNVIIRNLKVVGLNCTDNADCQSGLDACLGRLTRRGPFRSHLTPTEKPPRLSFKQPWPQHQRSPQTRSQRGQTARLRSNVCIAVEPAANRFVQPGFS